MMEAQMLQIQKLDFSYRGKKVLRQISFGVEQGKVVSIMGANGSGKSTLLRLLRGRLQPDGGEVRWGNAAAHKLSRREMALKVAVVPQQLQQPFGFQVREMVAMGRYIYQQPLAGPSRQDWKIVDEALASTDSAHLATRCSAELSGGELQRVMLARALAQQAPVLMLDEATSQLDMGHKRSICLLLRHLGQNGKTIVQVSHDMNSAAEISHKILLLSPAGEQIAFGSPYEVLTSAHIEAAYGVQVDIQRYLSTGGGTGGGTGESTEILRFLPQPLTSRSTP
ncbi:MAG: ABC transporter ATP-binding protein [Desulfuromonadaceae bacterium]|nr:ABC transporter ATP-binding protein [Desulfuromonadaceae bacterium]